MKSNDLAVPRFRSPIIRIERCLHRPRWLAERLGSTA